MARKYWTNEEIEIIKDNYGKIPNKELINRFPGRTKKQLVLKAFKLGLCKKDDTPRKGHLEVGDIIGDFEIIEIIKKGTTYTWECICKCIYGGIHKKRYKYLLEKRNSNKAECRCYKLNKYKLIEDYYVIVTYKGEEIYIDKEDYDVVSKYQWYVPQNGYAYSTSGKITLHRLIMGFPDCKQVDHKNGNRLDCRKNNLRICDTHENSYNVCLTSNNTSGFKGVSYVKKTGLWGAQIKYHGKTIWLGAFKNKIDAINKRLEAEKELFKDYSYYERENVDVDEAIENAI